MDLQNVLENVRKNTHFRSQDGSKMPQDDPKIVPRALLAALGPLLGHLGAILAHLGAILGPLRPIWRRSWASADDLGAILGPLGADLGRLGTILGRS